MNANTIITDDMTLEEKLLAIDAAVKSTQVQFNQVNGREVPVDPASLLICDGCE